MRDLIAKLEKLAGPDREVDAASESEKTATFWGSEATKAMLQGDYDEARRCLARAKRHAINAVRIRALKAKEAQDG